MEYVTTIDLPEDFALDQPLSPFLLAALELLDPESETYALDVISMVESTLDDPRQVLRAQERKARDAAIASMKADGIEYEERMERLEEVTYPKPLEELLDAAYERYCQDVPWARDFELSPKSVLRDMIETVSDFKGVRRGATASPVPRARFLRYLSDAYRVLARTVPADRLDDRLRDVIAWLGYLVRTVDSSLVDEWNSAGQAPAIAVPSMEEAVVQDRHGLTVMVKTRCSSVCAWLPRTQLVNELKQYKPAIVRGNASEIIALAGLWGLEGEAADLSRVRGVDTTDTVDAARDAAVALARYTGGAVVVSGEVDLITDGTTVAKSHGGSPLMSKITGCGCSQGGVLAVYACAADPFTAAVCGTAVYNVAGTRAAAVADAPASFKVAFIDELYRATAQDIADNRLELEEA